MSSLENAIDQYKLSSPMDYEPNQIESDQTDYFSQRLFLGQEVYVGDYIVQKEDLRRFSETEVNSYKAKKKLEKLLNMISLTVDEDIELLKEVNYYLGDVLINKIESVGIPEYYDMNLQEMEE
ncbi:hypothetical protein [Candidatus Enterococcus ferrettii]|uniref:Uncharacterized protein n=1 Tax=Candidatus Enterococcus ferrettii TaxID=2815324 RepID=A0ABV0EWE6_9ENTE|nr:hypothetical protein [Enterococcus sp. 665A]MBO1342114.1 hypothetical protein [Enterococcus sp. 665A]